MEVQVAKVTSIKAAKEKLNLANRLFDGKTRMMATGIWRTRSGEEVFFVGRPGEVSELGRHFVTAKVNGESESIMPAHESEIIVMATL